VIVCDVPDETAVNAAIRDIARLEILVDSAGIGLVGSIEETSLDDLQRLFRVKVEGTFLRPEEVADLAVYLASDESAFMNGAALPIDGG
jgi:NAD(P)-dependent dehydrogenase (short-subunit alcohol dehydrogenase family)